MEEDKKYNWMKIDGSIGLPENINDDEFWHLFIQFLESNKCCFLGVTQMLDEENNDNGGVTQLGE